MARLATFVHVTDDEGVNHAFGPADDVPAWAEALITNPKAWAEAPVPAPAPALKKATAKRAAPRRKAAPDDALQSG
ncbi:hypothetical protein [Streptomyces fractus]|uniref:hypothetical protein n=1 Tax=Streptomyces fractus TaxID=641806 RepID=UPI003CF49740